MPAASSSEDVETCEPQRAELDASADATAVARVVASSVVADAAGAPPDAPDAALPKRPRSKAAPMKKSDAADVPELARARLQLLTRALLSPT